ncbi:MAG TPA: nodulation protein NfeD [Thermoanaerobaculia bacterium]|jgi:membrane-bound serine protease (ClpP class)|nr:nodulation protein NfeD [Thermoanaerobaculia bacterium]
MSTLVRRTSILALFSLALLPLLAAAQQKPVPPGVVMRARVKAAVHPVSAELIVDAVRDADAARASVLIIELDTPGGLLTSTRDISSAILGAQTPVVVYVSPAGAQAASAGFFILMSADIAAMAPGTNTGAAHPVTAGGGDIEGTMARKVEEDSSANIRALARRNGRNVELAQAAVIDSRSYTADEALEGKLIDLIAPSFEKLVEALDGRTVKRGDDLITLRTRGAVVEEVEMSEMRRILSVIADPNIAFILLSLGGLGLYFELMNPGAILPGVVGGICLILAFFALSVLPVSYAGLALLFLALVLYIAEIKIVSHGVLAIGGTVALVLGALMLFKTPEPAMRVSLTVIASLAVFSLATVGFLMFMAIRARQVPVRTGREGLLHEIGTARSPIAPRGKVFVHGEIWDAVSEEPVSAGEPVEVVAVRNLTLAVRPHRRNAAV